MSKGRKRKAIGMVMEEVNENFREGQDEEAKINIVVGMPKIESVAPQLYDHASPPKQQQIPLDPPQASAPQPEVLHTGRISLRRGAEQQVIEDSVNSSLSPMKARNMKETDVYERLYADHQEKLIKENLLTSAANGEFDTSPPKHKVVQSKDTSPKPPRVYLLGPDLLEKRRLATENYIEQRRKEGYPQINEVSRQLAERINPTPDRRAFNEQITIIPPLRKDLSVEERSKADIEKNHYPFHPTITPLDPSILASPTAGAGAGAEGAAAEGSSSVSTPKKKRSSLTASSPASAAAAASASASPRVRGKGEKEKAEGAAAGAGAEGAAGAGGDENVPAFERLISKGEDMKKRQEERKKMYEDKETSECREPRIDSHSKHLIPEGSTFFKRYMEWVHTHIPPPTHGGSGTGTGTGTADGAGTDKAKGAAGAGAGAGAEGEDGEKSPSKSRTWTGKESLVGTSGSKDREDLKECTYAPQINSGTLPPEEDLEEWVENTYGVKKYLERTKLARDLKEEKPLFNPERKYPPPPTKFKEFNLSKTKKELQKEKEEEVETFEN